MKTLTRFILLAGVLLALVIGLGPNQAQASEQTENRLYLPLIAKPSRGIYGYVTLNGAPASGIPISLRMYDGQAYLNFDTQTPDATGYVSFQNAPSLQVHQFYYVQFQNASDTPGLVYVWNTETIHTYTQGSEINFEAFDIADVPLIAPPKDATIHLPYTFQWQPRPASPSDSYGLQIDGLPGYDPTWATMTPLGYVGSYTLDSLPPEFGPGMDYMWLVRITSPGGGNGICGELFKRVFQLAASSADQAGSRGELILQPELWELSIK